MKKFITSVPLQRTDPTRYQAVDNPAVDYAGLTAFPLIPLLDHVVGADETVAIAVIVTETADGQGGLNALCRENYERLQQEITALLAARGAQARFTTVIKPYDESLQVHLHLFSALIELIEDGDELYADCTYGTKSTPVLQMMALNYGYKLKTEVEIGQVIYGLYDHAANRGKDPAERRGYLYDITPLFYMSSLMDKLGALNLNDPVGRMQRLIATISPPRPEGGD